MNGKNGGSSRKGSGRQRTGAAHSPLPVRAFASILLLLLFTAASALAGPEGQDRPCPSGGNGETTVRLDDFLGRPPTKPEEGRVRAVLEGILLLEGDSETVPLRRDTRLVLLSWRDAAVRALRRNLLLMSEKDAADMAQEALMEAEAVFDPVFSFSFSHAGSDSYNRSRWVPVLTKRFLPGLPLRIPTAPGKDEAQIVELGWNYKEAGNPAIKRIYASQEPENGPTKTYEGRVDISQVLPWGLELHLSTATLYQETDYDNDGHSYHAPFSSSLMLELEAPLPGTRGFGPFAQRDTAVRLAEKDKAWGYWSVKALINTLLSQVHDAYWNLVASLESLVVARERRTVMEEQRTRFRRLFDDRLATTYDLHQIEAEYAASRVQETVALHALLSRAHALAILIEDDSAALEASLYLPYQYDALLSQGGKPREDAFETAHRCRPELKMAEIDLERTWLSRMFSEQQLQADLRVSASLTLDEDGSVYGYETPVLSMQSLVHPDSVSRNLQLTYTYPVGKNALKARHTQSKVVEKNAELSLKSLENTIFREVRNALHLMNTSENRMRMAQKNLDLIRIAFRKIQDRQALGEVRPFEWILSLQRLMEARLSLLLAKVDRRLALSRLAAAQGTLEIETVDRLSGNPGDRWRIRELTGGRHLVFFNPERINRAVPGLQTPGSATTDTSARRRP